MAKLNNSDVKETKRKSEIRYIPLGKYMKNKNNSMLNEHSRDKKSTNRHSINKSKPIKKFTNQNFGGRKSLVPLKILNLPRVASEFP